MTATAKKSAAVRLKKETVEKLKTLKKHPRETYDDVVKRLIEEVEKSGRKA